jgi:hypothetical protein
VFKVVIVNFCIVRVAVVRGVVNVVVARVTIVTSKLFERNFLC